ncbi:hypothetical protein L0152_27410, partial [bacterium]|nr:hypothetical protein [bacterium]
FGQRVRKEASSGPAVCLFFQLCFGISFLRLINFIDLEKGILNAGRKRVLLFGIAMMEINLTE